LLLNMLVLYHGLKSLSSRFRTFFVRWLYNLESSNPVVMSTLLDKVVALDVYGGKPVGVERFQYQYQVA